MSFDVEALIKMVGVEGARAALQASTTVTMDDLRSTVVKAGQQPTGSAKRPEIIDALLAGYENNLTKPLEELQKLSHTAIVGYFRKSRCSVAELELFLKRAKLPYRRGLTRTQLMADAARQISGLGLYDHIAGGPKIAEDDPSAHLGKGEDEPPGLEGIWYSDLGTRMNLRCNGDTLEGTYRRPDDTENDLFGRTGTGDATLAGRTFVSLVTLWDDGRRDANAATAWVGYVEKIGGEEIIVMSWVRIEGFHEPGRASTSVGRELLRRRLPYDEDVDRARKLLDAPYPRMRR